MGHLRQTMGDPCNSWSANSVKVVLQLWTINEATKDMEIISNIDGFSEKKPDLGQFGHFAPKMVRPHNFGSACNFF